MKYICKISHEQMNIDGGGFKRYEAGKIYDMENPDMEFFELIEGTAPDLGTDFKSVPTDESGLSPNKKRR